MKQTLFCSRVCLDGGKRCSLASVIFSGQEANVDAIAPDFLGNGASM
jgi:hypothetical protein